VANNGSSHAVATARRTLVEAVSVTDTRRSSETRNPLPAEDLASLVFPDGLPRGENAGPLRIVFLTMFMPGLKRTGAEVASSRFIETLRGLGHQVRVVGYRRVGTAPPIGSDDILVADRHIETSTAGLRPLGWMARALATGQPYITTKFITRAYRRAVKDELAASPDLVIVDHARMGWIVPTEGFDVPYIVIAHNVEHELYARLAAEGGLKRFAHRREARRIRTIERRLCANASQVWALTPHDAETLGALGGGTDARVLSLPSTALPRPADDPSLDVALLGGWHWSANAAGLRWFVDEVTPCLNGSELQVHVGGAAAEPIAGDVAGLHVRGRVPDALEFLQSARVIAVPSVSGAGVQVKTLDAIASGRPVVATRVALRGIDDPPATVTVVDDPADFAGALVQAARTAPDLEASRAAQAWVVERAGGFLRAIESSLGELRLPVRDVAPVPVTEPRRRFRRRSEVADVPSAA
jgi:glycosyltransferase involved in cell wall biosynthesis